MGPASKIVYVLIFNMPTPYKDIGGIIEKTNFPSLRRQGYNDSAYPAALAFAARLVLLPEKGGLSLAKNWRGICLLDIGSKILSNVMVKRMQALIEQVKFDMQTGFRPERGTIDGLFAVMMGLKKRQEHGLES